MRDADVVLLLESIKYDVVGKMSSMKDEVALVNKLDSNLDQLRREISRLETHFNNQLTY
tara:strand:+ start:68 stop:244 length:177 start_codon:yes stop_codon:yes gene_type:complete